MCARQLKQRVDIRRGDRYAFRELGDAWIPRGGDDRGAAIILGEAPCERVLATPAAHEENPH